MCIWKEKSTPPKKTRDFTSVFNLLFFEEITDMFLTPHPLFFKKGLSLFHGGSKKIQTKLNKRLRVDSVKDLYQYQYTIK